MTDADREETRSVAYQAYRDARRCWNCGAHWNDAGECPTKGCRGPGSGFERRVEPPEAPCVRCGTPTRRRAIGAIGWTPHARADDFTITEHWPWCAACELQRNIAQAEAIAANEAVYPSIREAARRDALALRKESA